MDNKGLAIIVGASRGIGECVASGLAGDGYQPVLIARNKEMLAHVSERIKEECDQISFTPIRERMHKRVSYRMYKKYPVTEGSEETATEHAKNCANSISGTCVAH